MARRIPYFLVRDGRHFARRTVPPELRPYIGTIELRESLGPDRKIALEKLPLALVKINARLDLARRALAAQRGADVVLAAARSAPMTPAEIARTHYNDQLALDEALRDSGPSWASVGIDDAYVADLRAASSGSLQDDQGLAPHFVDSIQGHTGRNASDGYGDVTLRAKKAVIDRLPAYDLTK